MTTSTDTALPRLLSEPLGLPATAKLWLNADEQVLALTASAHRLIRGNPGSLRFEHRRLRLEPDPAPLQDALRWVCAPSAAPRRERTLTVRRLDAAPLTLRLSRHSTPDTGAVHAIAWLADPDQLQLDENALREAFDFTPTETRVAVALANGSSSVELAQAWGLQTNTVQMHVKRLLAKTSTTRQAQLVGLLWRSAVLRLPSAPPSLAGGLSCRPLITTQTGNDGMPLNSHTPD